MQLPWNRHRRIPEPLQPGAVAISAQHLRVTLGSNEVLRGVDIEVKAGELLVLIGPNGAGKSTLLGALTGDIPARGVISLGGQLLQDWDLAELARYRAVLPQSNPVAFPFKVREVVEMGRAPWRKTAQEQFDDEAVSEAMRRMEIVHLAERPYPALSGGERARVSLARVLAQRAPVLLLDEPTAALDIRHQEAVLQLARERADRGDGVVVVLHELTLAGAYADKLALLSHGQIAAHGAPEKVLTEKLISEVYQYPVRVLENPDTGKPLVVPQRAEWISGGN